MSDGDRVTWPALESNPDAMNKYLREIGVSQPSQMCDVYGFDEELLNMVPQPIYAVLLVLPPNEKVASSRRADFEAAKGDKVASDAFFMRQQIRNACGTFALIHALANNVQPLNICSGALHDFLSAAKDVKPEERSSVLQGHKAMSTAHTACAESGDNAEPDKVEHHFICFVRLGQRLVEIDSSMPHPLVRGESSERTFMTDVGKVMKKYIELSDGAVDFSAMALVGSAP